MAISEDNTLQKESISQKDNNNLLSGRSANQKGKSYFSTN